MDPDDAATRLYGLPPDEFVAARTALAAEARAAGDRTSADAIRRLAKPSQPAWQVNLLVRRHPETVSELAAVAAALRSAAEGGDAIEVRRVDAERRTTMSRLADMAGALAQDAGKATTQATRREVEATLQAALSSPAAAEQVASGRLTAALFDSGLDALGLLTLAPAPPRDPGTAAGTGSRHGSGARAGGTPASSAAAGSSRRDAAPTGRVPGSEEPPEPTEGSAEADEALAVLERASEALTASQGAAAQARARADQLVQEVAQLSARLEAVRRRAEASEREAAAATERAAAARAEHDRARSTYDALTERRT